MKYNFKPFTMEERIVESYYEKLTLNSISDEIKKRLYAEADKVVDELMGQLDIKQVFMKTIKDKKDKEWIITTRVGPKEDET